MTTPWLTILGIGEDGIDGLTPAARAHLEAATLIIGGARHLALANSLIRGARRVWPSPIDAALPVILAQRPASTVVLASGDPYVYGVGTLLARHIPSAEMQCLPAISAFSLACARLGWTAQDCETISFCGRPIDALAPLLQPGVRVLALSSNAASPAAVAAYLTARGFGRSTLHVLEALGGPNERVSSSPAHAFHRNDVHALNMLAIETIADAEARVIPLASGLPDDAFEHDGQITKREIRAITLSTLAPRRGELLWDIGCGSGSIAIEWMLCHPANRAIGIDRAPDRAARAARNAASLGVPALRVITSAAPKALADLPVPNAIFVGGGIHQPALLDAAWAALPPEGRLVANAVTIESEAALLAARARLGGTLTRLSVERLDAIGTMHGYRPAMTVTQFAVTKP